MLPLLCSLLLLLIVFRINCLICLCAWLITMNQHDIRHAGVVVSVSAHRGINLKLYVLPVVYYLIAYKA